MDYFQTIFLALVQGLTEFLPISSSAHLILPFQILGWEDQGLAFDVAVHLGTLTAVIAYFWRDLLNLAHGFTRTLGGNQNSEGSLAIHLIIATLPIVIVGIALKSLVEGELRSASVIAFATIVFGLVLWLADYKSQRSREMSGLTWQHALMIGFAQCLALIPGTSRSGITMTAALGLGYTRQAASKVSFLLSVPTILGASLLVLRDLAMAAQEIAWLPMIVGAVISGITAYLCIRFFLGFIERIGFLPFVLYRLVLGSALLGFLYL